MAAFRCLMVVTLLLLLFFYACDSKADNVSISNCATNRSVLLKAIYETGDNLEKLEKAFYPVNELPSRFVRVDYHVKNTDNCNVAYFWAAGGFLLIQPPQIFQFTSLFFSYPAHQGYIVTLELPPECRVLFPNNSCSCPKEERILDQDTMMMESNDRISILDRVTAILNEVAKHDKAEDVDRGFVTTARVKCSVKNYTCEDDEPCDYLEDYLKKGEVVVYLSLTFLIPIMLMTVLALAIRSSHKTIHDVVISSSANYPTFAGVTLASSYILLFVLAMDCAALGYWKDHEFMNFVSNKFLSFGMLYVTISLDVVVSLIFAVSFLFLFCSNVKGIYSENSKKSDKINDCEGELTSNVNSENGKKSDKINCCKRWLTLFFKVILSIYFLVIFGGEPNEISGLLWQSDGSSKDNNYLNIWVATGLMVAPLFSLASHAGYMMMAWVTEPTKTTTTFFVGMTSFLFLFFVMRQCYKVNLRSDENCNYCSCDENCNCCSCCCENSCSCRCCCETVFCCYPVFVVGKQLIHFLCIFRSNAKQLSVKAADGVDTGSNDKVGLVSNGKDRGSEVDTGHKKDKGDCTLETDLKDKERFFENLGACSDSDFNLRSFFLAFSWGPLALGYIAFIITAFYLVPPSTVQVAEYIQTLSNAVIVILGLLVTYKIFTVEDSDIKRFAQSLRKAYNGEKRNEGLDDVEYLGAVAGEKMLNRKGNSPDGKAPPSPTPTPEHEGGDEIEESSQIATTDSQ